MESKVLKAFKNIRWLGIVLSALVAVLSVASLITDKELFQSGATWVAITGLIIVTFLTAGVIHSQKK